VFIKKVIFPTLYGKRCLPKIIFLKLNLVRKSLDSPFNLCLYCPIGFNVTRKNKYIMVSMK